MTVVDNLKEMWRCWSIVHGAVSKPDRDVDRLANAINIRFFASVLDYFYNHRVQSRGCYHGASLQILISMSVLDAAVVKGLECLIVAQRTSQDREVESRRLQILFISYRTCS
jgi:hypothetical protein